MPNLQEHQFRVAGVARIICENLNLELDKDSVICACLLHDMGNIIKFKLDYFPEFVKDGQLEYWQKVKEDYLEEYGHDEDRAALAIAEELGVSYDIQEIIDSIGFTHSIENMEGADFEKKIAAYADMRVSPYGIVTLRERLDEGHKRYSGSNKSTDKESHLEDEEVKIFDDALFEIERQIFAVCSISPEEINDEAVSQNIESLKEFMI